VYCLLYPLKFVKIKLFICSTNINIINDNLNVTIDNYKCTSALAKTKKTFLALPSFFN